MMRVRTSAKSGIGFEVSIFGLSLKVFMDERFRQYHLARLMGIRIKGFYKRVSNVGSHGESAITGKRPGSCCPCKEINRVHRGNAQLFGSDSFEHRYDRSILYVLISARLIQLM